MRRETRTPQYCNSDFLVSIYKVVDLIPGGQSIKVTEESKLHYLDVLAQYRLCSQVKDEVDSFLKGLHELIPDNLLSIFDEYELEVCRWSVKHSGLLKKETQLLLLISCCNFSLYL